MIVLSSVCSGSDEIPIDRAEQSGLWRKQHTAEKAIDDNLATRAVTALGNNPWLRVYFKTTSIVERVVLEKGHTYATPCIYSVYVYEKEVITKLLFYILYYFSIKCYFKNTD